MIEPVLGDQGAGEAEMEGRVMRAPHSKAGRATPLRRASAWSNCLSRSSSPGSSSRPWCRSSLNALSSTSRDARRNDAQLIAQDRIEQVRLLNYADIIAGQPEQPTESGGRLRRRPLRHLLHPDGPEAVHGPVRGRAAGQRGEGQGQRDAGRSRLHDDHGDHRQGSRARHRLGRHGRSFGSPADHQPVDHRVVQELGGRRPELQQGRLLDPGGHRRQQRHLDPHLADQQPVRR